MGETDKKPRELLITDYFKRPDKKDGFLDSQKWIMNLELAARKKYCSDEGTLDDKIAKGVESGQWWATRSADRQYKPHVQNTIQDTTAKPVLVGFDVVGLYPNLDPIAVAQVSADVVRETEVKFHGIEFNILAVYLLLVLGHSRLIRAGLGGCIPKRKFDSSSSSLTNSKNKDMKMSFGKQFILCTNLPQMNKFKKLEVDLKLSGI